MRAEDQPAMVAQAEARGSGFVGQLETSAGRITGMTRCRISEAARRKASTDILRRPIRCAIGWERWILSKPGLHHARFMKGDLPDPFALADTVHRGPFS
jgi:hypothetical protein